MRILAESRRRIAAYLAGLVFVAVLNLLVPKIIPLYNTTTLGYSVLLIIWTVTIRMRVVDREQRALFFFGGALWLLLFFTRFLKYRTAEYNPEAARYLWYFYYLPFALAPAVTLHSSIVLGNRQSGRKTPHSLPQAIWIFSGLLAVMVVTNDLHRLVFRFDSVEGYASYHYGPGYWVIIGWSILGLLVSFIIYQVKCSRTIGWHRIVPVVIGAAGIALLVWYVIEGGSPKVGGISLYNIQEVYAFTYIGIWESFIRIGLIPSNTDYEKLFALSTIRADLVENETEEPQVKKIPETEGEDLILRTNPVSGGQIRWLEDFGPIRKLTERLQEVTEDLLEENELVEEENRLQAERAAAEAQRRLYQRIYEVVRGQAERIHDRMEQTVIPGTFREDLAISTVLGTYIKRRANLELILQETKDIPVGELLLALREQRGYLELCGIACEVRGEAQTGSAVRGDRLLAAYELYETVLEAALSTCSAFSVKVEEEGFALTIETDACGDLMDESAWCARLEPLSMDLSLREDEDGTQIRLRERRTA